MRNAFIKILTDIARKDKRIVLLTGDLGFTVFEEFASKFPTRFYNMGVAEANMMSVAAGLSSCGLYPFVYSIATFASMRGFEQIRTDICFHKANVKIVGAGGGLSYGHAGFTHHSLEDISIMRSLPNMSVVCPADIHATIQIVKEIIGVTGPFYLRLGKKGEPTIYNSGPNLKIGKGNIIKEGKDVSIISTGNAVFGTIQASKILEKKGISTTVIDMHTVKPIDKKLILKQISDKKAVVTVEEHNITGGLGSAIAEIIAESGQKIIFKRIAIPDTFITKAGSQEYLRNLYGLTPPKIANSILNLLN